MKCISSGRFCVAFCCGQFADGAFQLNNTDHTSTVIDKVLEKYCIEDRPDSYCLLQMLPDGGLCTDADALSHTCTLQACKHTDALSHICTLQACKHTDALSHTCTLKACKHTDIFTCTLQACKHTDTLSHAPCRHANTLMHYHTHSMLACRQTDTFTCTLQACSHTFTCTLQACKHTDIFTCTLQACRHTLTFTHTLQACKHTGALSCVCPNMHPGMPVHMCTRMYIQMYTRTLSLPPM